MLNLLVLSFFLLTTLLINPLSAQSESCSFGDFGVTLQIDFLEETRTYGNCTVVPLAATEWNASLHTIAAERKGEITSSGYPHLPSYQTAAEYATTTLYIDAHDALRDRFTITNAELTVEDSLLAVILKSNWFGKLSLAIASAGFTKKPRRRYGVAYVFWQNQRPRCRRARIPKPLRLEYTHWQDSIYAGLTIDMYHDSLQFTSQDSVIRGNIWANSDATDLEYEQLGNTILQTEGGNLNQAANINASLKPNMLPQQYAKQLDELAISVLQNGNEEWSDHSLTVSNIASACPLEGGPAVYRARSVAALNDIPFVVDSLQNCGGGRPKRFSAPTASSQLTVYPNPTVNSITIRPEHLSSVAEIRVYDRSGKLVQRQTIEVKAGKVESLTVSVQHLPVGLYALTIVHNDATTSITKFVKQ